VITEEKTNIDIQFLLAVIASGSLAAIRVANG
jgi:hypothetical protein